jgi:hypothetical protein
MVSLECSGSERSGLEKGGILAHSVRLTNTYDKPWTDAKEDIIVDKETSLITAKASTCDVQSA